MQHHTIEITTDDVLANDPNAVKVYAALRPLVDQWNVDFHAQNDRVNEIRSRSPDQMSAKDVTDANSALLDNFRLSRRELDLRTRIRDEWFPLVQKAWSANKRAQYRAAQDAEKSIEQDAVAAIKGLGFDPAIHIGAFNYILRAHPALRAAREATSSAQEKMRNEKWDSRAEDFNNRLIAELQTELADQRQKLIAV